VRPAEPITRPARRALARYETGTPPSEPPDPRTTGDSGQPGPTQANPVSTTPVQTHANPTKDPYKQEVACSSQAPPIRGKCETASETRRAYSRSPTASSASCLSV
jgi:hypothetical protein